MVWPFVCDSCRLSIPDGAPVLYGQQDAGTGPNYGMSGWYVAIVHLDPCGADYLRRWGSDYQERPCRGCGRSMWVRTRSRRTHCNNPCRQADYRRRRAVASAALADGRVLYRDELYWLTRAEAVAS